MTTKWPENGEPLVVRTPVTAQSEQFVIEKNVPIPPQRKGRTWHPFGAMEPGDSVFIPAKGKRTPRSIGTTARSFGNAKGWKFTVREEAGGARVWRVK